uniref:Uncharacterized protein n=1 Tax=Cannabis sativa TaxID=3483 RepID=A0A803NHX6_CANSA
MPISFCTSDEMNFVPIIYTPCAIIFLSDTFLLRLLVSEDWHGERARGCAGARVCGCSAGCTAAGVEGWAGGRARRVQGACTLSQARVCALRCWKRDVVCQGHGREARTPKTAGAPFGELFEHNTNDYKYYT